MSPPLAHVSPLALRASAHLVCVEEQLLLLNAQRLEVEGALAGAEAARLALAQGANLMMGSERSGQGGRNCLTAQR